MNTLYSGFFIFGLAAAATLYFYDPILFGDYQRVMILKSTGQGSDRQIDVRLKDGTIASLGADAGDPQASGIVCVLTGPSLLSGENQVRKVAMSNCPLPRMRTISTMTTTSPTGTSAPSSSSKSSKSFSRGSPNSSSGSSDQKRSFGSSMGFSNR